eukprot:gi/632986185/ref/XP_007910094.1/ PREDICTED: alanyl-tRNA editing protein Aarsd1 [Callorhinchus milii]
MAFACQRESYSREFTSSVVSCTPAKLKTEVNGKKEEFDGYNVILKDTILFPEGGGQPDDRGYIEEIPVLRVTREGGDAVHFVQSPLEPSHEVHIKIDWDRRFDHMQQHSGQHLISAVAESMFGFVTTSWELGRQRSVIELDTKAVTAEQVQALEATVNEHIRAHLPVTVQLVSADHPQAEKFGSSGLPGDRAGPIRVIEIPGVDQNMCCGTHVSNLSHLQVIKLLGTDKGKKNKTNLIFLVGNRVLSYMDKCLATERALTSLLKNGPNEHVQGVDKLQKSVKLLHKNSVSMLRDLAIMTANTVKSDPNKGKIFVLHRKEGDSEFMNILANELVAEVELLFLTVGEEKGSGLFLLAGRPEAVETLGPKALLLLDGKGAGKNGRYQGKANKMGKRPEVEALLRKHLETPDTKEE